MASIYRVNYSTKSHGDASQLASATTVQNAIAAVVAADTRYKQTVSVTEVQQAGNILVGS